MSPIFTINSRGHIMLEILRDHYGLVGARMKREIQRMHGQLLEILASKEIKHNELRSALVPGMDRHEALFIFDSEATGSDLYGRDIFDHILPALDPTATQSILVGDLLGEDQGLILKILREFMVLARSFKFKHATLLYGVYINNLSEKALVRLHNDLSSYGAYLGYIPTTFMSPAKIYASTTMVGFLLKKGKTLIMAHEDDRPNKENINITPYDLESHGYNIKSLQSNYFSIFLTYKIERPVLFGDRADADIALNSISEQALPLAEFSVLLDEAKHGYLINEKLGKLKQAGLEKADRAQIEKIIQSKIEHSYIYNLKYLEQHDVMTFNIALEMPRSGGYPARLTAALEYKPEEKILRVITLH